MAAFPDWISETQVQFYFPGKVSDILGRVLSLRQGDVVLNYTDK